MTRTPPLLHRGHLIPLPFRSHNLHGHDGNASDALSPSLLLPSLTSPSILILKRAVAGVTPPPEAPADGEAEAKACATGDDDHQRADEWSLASSSG
jgi:hypothetical protein